MFLLLSWISINNEKEAFDHLVIILLFFFLLLNSFFLIIF